MGFEDLLRRRLGPLGDLVPRRRHEGRPGLDTLWIRRAAGVEVEARPALRPNRVRARGADRPRDRALDLPLEAAGRWIGLTEWCPSSAAGLPPSRLEALIEAELMVWARADPRVALPPARLPAGWRGPVARRRAAWPTPAIETALAVSPMPFMPRDRDLDGAAMVGLRFATLERGFEILGATVLGDDELGADLRALLPRLDGSLELEALARIRGREREPRLSRLLAHLEALGALEPAPEDGLQEARQYATDRAQVTWLGHAAVLLQVEGRALLVDPLFHAASEPPADPHLRPDPRALPRIDGVLITHGDNDHLSPNALVQLEPETPVFLPRVRTPPPPHQVDMEGVLRVLGFSDLRPLDPFDRVELGPFVIHALPFDGEDWGLEQAQLTYLVESRELSCFFSADSRGPLATYRWLAGHPHRVDLAFMGVSGAAEPLVSPTGLGYGSFYAPWIPTARRGEFVLHTADPETSARYCRVFQPRRAFGYAAGGVPYIRTEYPDRGTHAELAARLEGTATRGIDLPIGEPIPAVRLREG